MSEKVKQDAEDSEFKVDDKRHWAAEDDAADSEPAEEVDAQAIAEPAVIEAYRNRTEAAEEKLQEYIEACQSMRAAAKSGP